MLPAWTQTRALAFVTRGFYGRCPFTSDEDIGITGQNVCGVRCACSVRILSDSELRLAWNGMGQPRRPASDRRPPNFDHRRKRPADEYTPFRPSYPLLSFLSSHSHLSPLSTYGHQRSSPAAARHLYASIYNSILSVLHLADNFLTICFPFSIHALFTLAPR
jgi:hypothetical protein